MICPIMHARYNIDNIKVLKPPFYGKALIAFYANFVPLWIITAPANKL